MTAYLVGQRARWHERVVTIVGQTRGGKIVVETYVTQHQRAMGEVARDVLFAHVAVEPSEIIVDVDIDSGPKRAPTASTARQEGDL